MSSDGNHSESRDSKEASPLKTTRWHYARTAAFRLTHQIRIFRRWLCRSFRNPDNLPLHLTALFTLLLVGFAYYAWQEATQGTIALRGQLDQMKAAERPWVYASEVLPAGRISLEENRYFIPLRVTIQNKGHRPAFEVIQKTDAKIIKMGSASTRSVRNDVCDSYRSEPAKSSGGDTIFPEQRIAHGGFTHDDYPRVEKRQWDELGPDRLIVIFGCIDYQFPAEPGHHQSRFSFVAGTKQDQGILERIGVLPDDPTSVDIRLLPVPIDAGIPAD